MRPRRSSGIGQSEPKRQSANNGLVGETRVTEGALAASHPIAFKKKRLFDRGYIHLGSADQRRLIRDDSYTEKTELREVELLGLSSHAGAKQRAEFRVTGCRRAKNQVTRSSSGAP
ncbi:hypothetical protein NE237_012945 [Protea cynaroides]|uniref:Uncharacterized protein n=1 Tax=Protea cynaroides TaxID=273540 RepID=A0A9Q0JYJ2_9MAGN|nr:hypothetical protein NE237_012945 [Protea cynaroides]